MNFEILDSLTCLHRFPSFTENKTKNLLQPGPSSAFGSGTVIERRRRSPSAEGTSGGRAREGVRPTLVRVFFFLGGGGGVVTKDDQRSDSVAL